MNPKDKYTKFNDENDLSNKNISLQSPQPSLQGTGANSNYQPKFISKLAGKGDDLAAGIVVRENNNVSEKMSGAIIASFNEKLKFIGQYFNVEVDDIKEKLITSMTPLNKNFYPLAEKNPDLYGPFWIFTTLIFLISLAGNLSNLLESPNRQQFKYNFNFIPNAALVIYTIGFGIPILLFFLMKFMFKVDIPLILNICIYGYSYAALGPILLLCILPVDALQSFFLFLYFIQSSYFLVYNMLQFIVEKAQSSKFIILGILVGFQFLLFLIFKFYFFASFGKN